MSKTKSRTVEPTAPEAKRRLERVRGGRTQWPRDLWAERVWLGLLLLPWGQLGLRPRVRNSRSNERDALHAGKYRKWDNFKGT